MIIDNRPESEKADNQSEKIEIDDTVIIPRSEYDSLIGANETLKCIRRILSSEHYIADGVLITCIHEIANIKTNK